MSQFASKWEKPNSAGFTTRMRDSVKNPGPLEAEAGAGGKADSGPSRKARRDVRKAKGKRRLDLQQDRVIHPEA